MDRNTKYCGCKGIRTCLICENLKRTLTIESTAEDVFAFCAKCGLCWGRDEEPLYVEGLAIVTDFVSEEEEATLIQEIDRCQWQPSQSGRRKQDYGPKVNFKKKKGKLGDFKGFPVLAEAVVERLGALLPDFAPVELCNLEYCPERGSAIAPHCDDAWIWGERLLTLSLAAPTVLVLTPSGTRQPCDCSQRPNKAERNGCIHNKGLTQASDMCTAYRYSNAKVEVRVELPARSLFVLSGCMRKNWFHAIRRQDVTSRRLAMTFRELSDEFREGGSQVELGAELLKTAKIFF